jgi:vacuolar-type H+-ATPase subunit C/Vma6
MGANCLDWDYLGARLHARRARICGPQRLELLCGLHGLPALLAELGLPNDLGSARALGRHLVRELVAECLSLVAGSQSRAANLVHWMLARDELELVKAVVRGMVGRLDKTVVGEQLPDLPSGLGPRRDVLLSASSPEEIVGLLNDEALQSILKEALARYRPDELFLFESALSQGYYRELLLRARRLGQADGLLVPLMAQEADSFQLMLVARGHFHDGMPAETLRPLHVEGTPLSRSLYFAMLDCPDLPTAARHAQHRVVDQIPAMANDALKFAARLERLCGARTLKLAQRIFRRSDMGPGLLVGYLALRRIEVANLITVAEGLRLGVPAEALRARLLADSAKEEARAA